MSVNEDGDAKVRRVHVIGAENTRVILLQTLTFPLFKASTVSQLLNTVNSVRQNMSMIGVFSRIQAVVDVANEEEKSGNEQEYEVTLLVRERRRLSGSVRTEVETNGMAVRMGGRYLNATGRADVATMEFIRGSNAENGYAFQYTLPFNADASRNLNFGWGRTSFDNAMPFLVPPSSYRQRESYLFLGYEMPIPHRLPVKYGIRLEHLWRRIEAAQQLTALPLRSLEGDNVKTALRHFISMDTRDSTILPTSGYLAKVTQELSAPPGDTKHIKHEFEWQLACSLRKIPLTIHASLNAGHILPLSNQPVSLPDRYFVGGPLTLRGFTFRGVGHSSGPASNDSDSSTVGGSCFWLAALHAYAPLPFLGRPTQSSGSFDEDSDDSISNPIQLHGFVSAGDLSSSGSRLLQSLSRFPKKDESLVRVSAGAGVVMRLGTIARLELNYTLPLRVQSSDSVRPGFQFGIGVQFV